MFEKSFRAMGCEVKAMLDGGERETLEALPAWFEAREALLSRFRPRSALSQLNAQPGTRCAVAPALWHALDVALEAAAWTGGLVTPTVGEAMLREGYDRDFSALTGTDGARAVSSSTREPAPDWRGIDRDFTSRTVRLPPGVSLDLGGTVKGAVADELARRLALDAPALVDVGGDIAARGPQRTGEPWPVAVADPRGGKPLELLAVANGGIATSGRDFRRWRGGHHLIDPRTGAPSSSEVLSATVIADATLTAEVAAKVVVLLGARQGLAWLERHGLVGLAVLDDGAVLRSAGFDDFVWR